MSRDDEIIIDLVTAFGNIRKSLIKIMICEKKCRSLVSFPQGKMGFGDQTPTLKYYNLGTDCYIITNFLK